MELHVKKLLTLVWTKFSVIGFHRWPEAPVETSYLRDVHRHEFGIEVTVMSKHGDRDVEFHALKRDCIAEIKARFGESVIAMAADELWFASRSCEHIAEELAGGLAAMGYIVHSITVNEDGENGATIMFDTSDAPGAGDAGRS